MAETVHVMVCTHAFSNWFEIITHNYTHVIWHFAPPHTESRLESVAIMCGCVGRVIKPEASIRPSQSQSQSSVCPSHAPSTHTSTSLQYIFSRWLSFQMTVPWMFPGQVLSELFFFQSFFFFSQIMHLTFSLKVMNTALYMFNIPSASRTLKLQPRPMNSTADAVS